MTMRVGGTSKIRRRRDLGRSQSDSTYRSRRSIGETLRDTATIVLLLASPSVVLGLLSRSTVVAMGVLAACKIVAFAAMSAGRNRKSESISSQRLMLTEAVTLGVLVAFVLGLSLGQTAFVPRPVLLLDWLTTLALVFVGLHQQASANRAKSKSAKTCESDVEPEPLPEVRASVRGRTIMLSLPAGKAWNALIDQVDALDPGSWIVSGGDQDRIDQIAAAVTRVSPRQLNLRDVFTLERPSIVIHVLSSQGDLDETRALVTRRLVNESLRAGVECFVLITPDTDRGISSVLSERIIGALSGLTRTRMVRVRLSAGVEESATARRVLRLAAKGRNGTIISLGKTGGSCIEGLGGNGDSAELWTELDRIDYGS